MTVTLDLARRLLAAAEGLAVVTSLRRGGTAAASLVNAGVVAHPVTGAEVLGFVVRADAVKLGRYRRQRHTTVAVHAGWEWAAVTGPVELCGPDDPLEGVSAADLPSLLREVYVAAGGSHDDWDTFDRVMAAERRTAVLVRPERLSGNHRT